MTDKRNIEVFSAGCPACEETVALVNSVACSSCEIEVLDMNRSGVAERAKQYGVHRVPAVVVDGTLADCCQTAEINADGLRAAGVGVPL